MRAAPEPQSIRDPEEVFLVDRVKHRCRCPLNDFIFQRSNGERALPSIRLWYIDPPIRQRPIRSSVQPTMQLLEIALEVCFIGSPRQPVHAGCGVFLEFEERRFEMFDAEVAEVVEERSELLLLPSACCCLPYAFQRLGHAYPALCPVRALLVRIPLGLRPWLHRFRGRSLRLVHRLPSYYGGVRLLTRVHHRLRLLAFPMRTDVHMYKRSRVRPPGSRTRSVCTCQGL